MGDTTSNYSTPPPSPQQKSNMTMLYYGLVVVGTAAIVLVIYNLIVVRLCARQHRQSLRPMIQMVEPTSSRSFDNPNISIVSSFKYMKEGEGVNQVGQDYECAVCLSVFQEGEEMRQLSRCKHSFHAPCIDMWLYSHWDCPLCRSPVGPPPLRRHLVETTSENSREVLLDPSISV